MQQGVTPVWTQLSLDLTDEAFGELQVEILQMSKIGLLCSYLPKEKLLTFPR